MKLEITLTEFLIKYLRDSLKNLFNQSKRDAERMCSLRPSNVHNIVSRIESNPIFHRLLFG